jgi:hypothetical protein
MEHHCDQRNSIGKKHQQEENLHDNHPKRKESLHKSNSKIESENEKFDKIENNQNEEEQLKRAVNTLRPYDVICGRGSIPFNNIGNRRFRILISMNVHHYNECDGRNRKGLYIRSLVRTFEEDIGIRFFKLKNGRLIQLTPRQIRQKVGHALRDVLAFQESQLQLEKEREEEAKTKQLSMVPPTNRPEPWVVGPTTMIPRSMVALSSARSRVIRDRSSITATRFQNNDLPSSIPPPYPSTYESSTRTPRQDSSKAIGFNNYAGNQDMKQHISSLRASTTIQQQQQQQQQEHSLGPSSVSTVPRQHNFQTERDNRHFPRHEEKRSALQNFISNYELQNNEIAQDQRDGNNNYIHNSSNYRCDDEGDDSFEDDDFVPLPIDHPGQGNDMIDMFGC